MVSVPFCTSINFVNFFCAILTNCHFGLLLFDLLLQNWQKKKIKKLLFLWQNFFLRPTCLLMSTHRSLLYLPVAYTKIYEQCMNWVLGTCYIGQLMFDHQHEKIIKMAIIWHMFFPMWLLLSIHLWFLYTLTFDQLSFWPIAVWLIVVASAEEENKNLLFLGHNFFLLMCLVMSTHWSLLYLPVAY